MDLSTQYMGMKLKNPLVASASPLSVNIDSIRELQDAGIAAIVLPSLFQEQLTGEIYESHFYPSLAKEKFPESLSYFPRPGRFALDPKEYLVHIDLAKKAVEVPIIASLNVYSQDEQWIEYPKLIEKAGADGLELNIYFLAVNPKMSAEQVEDIHVEIVRRVKEEISIPVAVKLSPYYSAMANMAKKLEEAGADALVLFNRFYQPDFDLERLKANPNLVLSTTDSKRLPLTWISILRHHLKIGLAATSGIHDATDVLKTLMVGADVTMVCSVLLKQGVNHTQTILKDLRQWMTDQHYKSITQFQGSLSQKPYEDPHTFERASYIKALQHFTK